MLEYLLPLGILAAFGAYGWIKTGLNVQDNTKVRFSKLGSIKLQKNQILIYFDIEIWNYSKQKMMLQEYDIKINFYPGKYGDANNKKEVGRMFKTNGSYPINPGQNILKNMNTQVDYTFAFTYLLACIKTGDFIDLEATGYMKIDGNKYNSSERITFKGTK